MTYAEWVFLLNSCVAQNDANHVVINRQAARIAALESKIELMDSIIQELCRSILGD